MTENQKLREVFEARMTGAESVRLNEELGLWPKERGMQEDEFDDDEGPEDHECHWCRGDGMDPYTDYLLPCPYCQGDQRP